MYYIIFKSRIDNSETKHRSKTLTGIKRHYRNHFYTGRDLNTNILDEYTIVKDSDNNEIDINDIFW